MSSALRKCQRFFHSFVVIAAVFAYATVASVIHRSEGPVIASAFILLILAVGVDLRVPRSFELRVSHVELDKSVVMPFRTADPSSTGQLNAIGGRAV